MMLRSRSCVNLVPPSQESKIIKHVPKENKIIILFKKTSAFKMMKIINFNNENN